MSNIYKNISGTGKSVICPAPAVLSKVIINSVVTANTITVYDYSVPSGATGPAGATGSVAIITTAAAPVSLPYDIEMHHGIVFDAGATGGNVTIAYRKL
jgi:hypothetical protein